MKEPAKARLAYLTTPQRGRYVLAFQTEDSDEIQHLEITQRHLANIVIDGTTLALRDIDHRAE